MPHAARASRRVASLLRRSTRGPAAELDPWGAYLSAVEPALAGVPRAHRFAQPPLLGDPGAPAASVAVWIEQSADPTASERTRGALEQSTTPPASVSEGSLAQVLGQTRSEYIALVHAGDVPAPLALERIGQAALLADRPRVITCDDDVVTPEGERRRPRFRPGPSPDRWLACDDSGPLLVVAREDAAAALPLLRSATSWRHELALRLGGPAAEHHAHVPLLLCHRDSNRSEPPPLAARDLELLLADWGDAARVEQRAGFRSVRPDANV